MQRQKNKGSSYPLQKGDYRGIFPSNKQAFTLVELIVVITILAILGTISFISFQGYSTDARNSTRVADIKTIEKSLQIYSTRNDKYPEPQDGEIVSYGGETVYLQGTFGSSPYKEVGNLSNIPVDPLTKTEYIYSTTNNQTEYEILAIYEGQVVNNSILNQTHAAETYKPKVSGTYNHIYVKTNSYYIPIPSLINSEVTNTGITLDSTNINSFVVTNGNNLPQSGTQVTSQTGGLNINLSVYTGGTITSSSDQADKVALAQKLQGAYTGTSLSTKTTYKNLLSKTTTEELAGIVDSVVLGKASNTTISNNDNNNNNNNTPTALITSTDCTDALWIWINDTLDTIGNGYCISPRVEGGTEYISWMDIGTNYGWSRTGDTTGMTTANAYAGNNYGVTYDLGNYTCKSLGTATQDFDTINGQGDTIYNRMKWLADNKTSSTELDDIDWVTVPSKPTTFTVPALMLSDCIDGERDLSDTNTYEGVTYAEYSGPANDEASRIKMNRYLLGWTKQSGSHLPSAYSDISSEIGTYVITNKGEYQIACEAGKFGSVTWDGSNQYVGSNDDTNNERTWLAALGGNSGIAWGGTVRTIGHFGCGGPDNNNAGYNDANISARFVVRP